MFCYVWCQTRVNLMKQNIPDEKRLQFFSTVVCTPLFPEELYLLFSPSNSAWPTPTMMIDMGSLAACHEQEE